jgi:hypothetical protein
MSIMDSMGFFTYTITIAMIWYWIGHSCGETDEKIRNIKKGIK